MSSSRRALRCSSAAGVALLLGCSSTPPGGYSQTTVATPYGTATERVGIEPVTAPTYITNNYGCASAPDGGPDAR